MSTDDIYEAGQRLVCKRGDWTRINELERDLIGARGNRAGDLHDAVMHVMRRHKARTRREYIVPGGRIDVVAVLQDNTVVALELDNRRPRRKSVTKLEAVPAGWITGILLRNPK